MGRRMGGRASYLLIPFSRGPTVPRDGGFTLVETLVAITVIGILLLPLLSVIARQVRFGTRLSDVEIALQLAQETAEEVLTSSSPELDMEDDTSFVSFRGVTWRVETDVLNGNEDDEPEEGTDPLEIHIEVYREGIENPLARLFTLKED